MFDKGKINIGIQRSHYEAGDIIVGKVALTFKKPVKAKELSISLIGEQTSIRIGGMIDSSTTSTSTEHTRVYDFKQQIDDEKEYTKESDYDFEIKILADIFSIKPQMSEMSGMAGQGLRIVKAAAAMTGTIPLQRTKWYLLAKLDIPGGLDIKRKADITIG